MAQLKVNPTRMELTRLKKRLKVADRGHKLLKDKRDEMIRQFMKIIKQNKVLRAEVEEELLLAQREFTIAGMSMSGAEMEEALMVPAVRFAFRTSRQNIMSVTVPKIEFSETPGDMSYFPYGFTGTSGALDTSVKKLAGVFAKMIKLAEIEKTCNMLADEIEKTRRRVNALEYVLIPQLEETIKYITMKLEENELGNLTRLMKMKDLLEM
jgi:V/A-type H+-transporting ATPase subunit D